MTQSINEQIGTLPAIESEFHLFEVGREMLCTNPVPRSHDAALEKRKGGFDCVGVNVSNDVHARTVVDFLVIRSLGFPHGRIVRGCIIGENYFHILRNILADVPCKRSTLRISCVEKPEIAVALADADHYFFVVHPGYAAFAFIPSANVSNVHLDFSVEHGLIGLRHGVPYAMAEVPSRLIAHSDRALNLASRHSLLRFAEQVRRQKPLAERQVRIVEHGAGRNGELVVAVFAVEELLVGIQLDHWPFAAQTLRAFGEAETDQKLTALIFGTKQGVYIN
jgi:hypothetical protein